MDAIKDRIAKLLALSGSSNENEAKATLLKTREPMAKHKLRPEELQRISASKVIESRIGVFCAKRTDTVAAAYYCCKSVRYHQRNAKKTQFNQRGNSGDVQRIWQRSLPWLADGFYIAGFPVSGVGFSYDCAASG